ncbi:MAG: hypothetical protein FJZ38_14045 [Candidatus Rokubacteria bacterium]|nr:hypothetical protein [Candidatus Rokubacteria bacterium]
MELLDPTVEQPQQAIDFAPRPKALAGKRVALIENTKYNSDRLLEKIGDILKKEQGIAEWKIFHKHNSSVPAHKEVIDEVKAAYDLMVAGVGD